MHNLQIIKKKKHDQNIGNLLKTNTKKRELEISFNRGLGQNLVMIMVKVVLQIIQTKEIILKIKQY